MPTILAIETSCDETGLAIVRQEDPTTITVLGSAVASQIDTHALTGGVIPEVAAREHSQIILPLLEKVIAQANISLTDVDAIAVTVGPGLMPALSVGVQTARTLAYKFKKPIVPVHHIEGHIYAALFQEQADGKMYHMPKDVFPAIALIVSGGHTLLIYMDDHLHYKTIGTTRDDAAGEAFDKVARLLNLPYPGGPHVARLAAQGNPNAFDLPRPMLQSGDLNMSFSGLKTAVLYLLRDNPDANRADVAASFQQAVIDTLSTKLSLAIEQYEPQTILLSGGVAANGPLRERVESVGIKRNVNIKTSPLHLCGDNAVMIGQVGLYALAAGRKTSWRSVDAAARLPIDQFALR